MNDEVNVDFYASSFVDIAREETKNKKQRAERWDENSALKYKWEPISTDIVLGIA